MYSRYIYVLDLNQNLLSVKQLAENDYSLHSGDNSCMIMIKAIIT